MVSRICIHTIVKDEPDEYLIPWLNHHTGMVDHIFVYEDINSHSHKHVTDQYDNVTLSSVSGEGTQRQHMKDGLLYIQSLGYDWCITMDIDEFVTLQSPYTSITAVLSDYNDYDGVLLRWMNFGASGRVFKPDYNGRDYREFYTERCGDTHWDGTMEMNTKVAWNLRKISEYNITGIHFLAGNWTYTNGRKHSKTPCYEKMYLKHYITRSWEEYVWKVFVRGMHSKGRHRKVDDFFELNPDMLDKYDELIEIKNKLLIT